MDGRRHGHPTIDFDRLLPRRGTDSIKWSAYEEDVLPMWVADMDFAAPPAVIDALHERVRHGVFGYAAEPNGLRRLVTERLRALYEWSVDPDDLLFVPNVVVGFNLTCQALATSGDGLLIQPPIYFPILDAPEHASLEPRFAPLTWTNEGTYAVDFGAFEEAARQSRVFLLCNPHNPVGRVYRRDELERMAEICLRHDVLICSDEIHADFVFAGHEHIPIGSIDPEIGARTVTLIAPNKTYNIAGVPMAIAIVPDASHRRALREAARGLVPHVGALNYAAAVAAYRHGQSWLDALLDYLEANRDVVRQTIDTEFPGIRMPPIEGTYLAWLDCRDALSPDPQSFFLEEARVALNDGARFGLGGDGFVRLNFACPRSILRTGLERMRDALDRSAVD